MRTFVVGRLLVSCLCGVARADEPAQPRVAARHAIVAGDLSRARAILADARASDAGAAERAAVAELDYVIKTWSPSGRPPSATMANDAPIPDDEEDWEHAFARARSLLLDGHYAEAARRFDTLIGTAPDLVAGARAAEVRALAREAADVVPAAPPPPSSSSPSRDEPEMEARWYGWQTLIVDGASLVMTPLVPGLGVAGYFLGGPIVHLAHWHGLHMLGSLGVRVVGPTVGVLAGYAVANGCNGVDCRLGGAAVGGLVGIAVAIAVDAAVIARDEVPVSKTAVRVTPILAPGQAGLVGTF